MHHGSSSFRKERGWRGVVSAMVLFLSVGLVFVLSACQNGQKSASREQPRSRYARGETYRDDEEGGYREAGRARASRRPMIDDESLVAAAEEEEQGAATRRPRSTLRKKAAQADTADETNGASESRNGAARRGPTALERRAGADREAASEASGDESANTSEGKGTREGETATGSALEVSPEQKSVAELILELQDPLLASSAYRRIWQAPKAVIPELIREVENPSPSRVERIQILVADPDFAQASDQTPANRIKGLGPMEMVEMVGPQDTHTIIQGYTKMVYSPSRNKKAYQVVLEKGAGFPVGVVIRAGLINRIRSTRYPNMSDDELGPGKLVQWWRQYYALAQQEQQQPAR